ncbi:MAG TPA: choice-of-anchor tandem repeat GloVer-containing protein, partial [Rhizomicrobium sp.]|nr:choice-of-anchor tandem repeat GloVer-containing protein [Rhizomicrobium sp.]
RLAVDKKGVLTGTTELGGTLSDGTAFQLTPPKKHQTAWGETVLHNFGALGDAVGPFTGLARGLDGTLYGCATWGKNGIGAVYSLSGTSEKVLYNFGDQPNDPNAASICAVTVDNTGTLYGTANSGGANGKGALFEIAPPSGGGTAWTETVLHSFGPGDGQSPSAAPLKRGKMLYGATALGGAGGAGAVYVLKP